jgi:uncharacterized protein
VRAELKQRADHEAVEVFAENLRNLLLTLAARARPVIGIDPGLRTGCKCAASTPPASISTLDHLHQPGRRASWSRPRRAAASSCARTSPAAIAVGNGTGGRETEAFVRKTLVAPSTG